MIILQSEAVGRQWLLRILLTLFKISQLDEVSYPCGSIEASELTFVIGNKLLHFGVVREKMLYNYFQIALVVVIPELSD